MTRVSRCTVLPGTGGASTTRGTCVRAPIRGFSQVTSLVAPGRQLPGLAGQRGRGGQDQGGEGDRTPGRLGGRGPDRRALARQGQPVPLELPAERHRARPACLPRPGEHASGREEQHGTDDLFIERGNANRGSYRLASGTV